MMQTEPLDEPLTTAIADGDSFRYYPGFVGEALNELRRNESQDVVADEHRMQLLCVQRLHGGWQSLADLALAPGDGLRGRPHPDLILTALIRLQIDAVYNVAALGDTTSDIESSRRAGASVAAGTLTGAHNERELRDAGATHIVDSVTQFADLILQRR